MRFNLVAGIIVFGLLSALVMRQISMASDERDVEKFVRVSYRHGLPYLEASKFDKTAVPTLLRMLASDKEKPYWANIVLTLGIIGDDSAIDPLVNFLEKRFQGEVDLDTLNALLSVSPALGHAAYKGNKKALDYLLKNHTDGKFALKGIGWRFQKYKDDTLHILLCKMVIRGLAVSGQKPARELLVRMQTDQTTEYKELRQHCRFNISEGLELHDRLVKDGPKSVFPQ